MTEPLLSVRGLTTRFRTERGSVTAVDDFSFDVAPGETLAVVGESGSGKSVTALSILRLIPNPPGQITGGQILFEGEDLIGAPLTHLQDVRGGRIAYIFQDPVTTLNPLLPVGEQVAESLRRHQGLSRQAAARRAVELLDRVRIPEPRQKASAFPHQMSGGQRQRVVIAMALANQPALLIADEPTTALDVTTQARVLELLNELRRETGAALIFITHDLGVVRRICSRVAVLYAGRVVETSPTAELFYAPQHPYTRGLIAAVPRTSRGATALATIPGSVPADPGAIEGCAFRERCELAIDRCAYERPELREVRERHLAACHVAGEEQRS
jgi:oligopeptide transport system ATP-binding protein